MTHPTSPYDTPEYEAFQKARQEFMARTHRWVATQVRSIYPRATGLALTLCYSEDGEHVSLDHVTDVGGFELSENDQTYGELSDQLFGPLNDLHDLDHPIALFDADDTGTYELAEDPVYGHCDTCGSPCAERGCTLDQRHEAAIPDVRGCSCGMADYGAPGHDGHDAPATTTMTALAAAGAIEVCAACPPNGGYCPDCDPARPEG